MAKLHATDYLAQPGNHPPKPVCVAFGDESFLRRQVLLGLRHAVLSGDDGDLSLTSFDGRTVEFRDVVEEVATLAMFGPQRLVVVDEGDEFVSRYRQELEDYVAKAGRGGILVLNLKTCASNTRLYKAVDAKGLLIDCGLPAKGQSAFLRKWIADWGKQTHKIQIAGDAADLLVELVGPELGLLDQELAKLALMTGDKKITPELVQRLVGSWHAKTTWDMLDFALAGNLTEALRQTDLLLSNNEAPIALLAQISSTLRRMAAATRLVLQAEAKGRRTSLAAALEQLKVNKFFLDKTESQLKRLGRKRGAQLYRWLLEADLDLKGDSQLPPRLVLERLLVRLAVPA
jgi:DNA polymerase III subunit delta